MNRLTNWIKRHQVVAFFIITFAITWGLGFTYDAVLNKGLYVLAPLSFLATCGPALAGILITAVTNTEPRQGTHKAAWSAFLVAWIVSAFVFLAHNTIFNRASLSPVLVGLTFVLVMPVAFVISMAYSRILAVKTYLASLIRLRGVWGWALLALVLTPALILLSVPVSSLLGRQPLTAHQFPATGLALIGLVTVKFLYQLFFFNATGEEVGWRGFALPRLQARTSPMIAAFIIAIFWTAWHFFLWQAEGKPVLTLDYWIEESFIHLLFSVFIGWIYNRAKGNILVAALPTRLPILPSRFSLALTFRLSARSWRLLHLASLSLIGCGKSCPPTTRRYTTPTRLDPIRRKRDAADEQISKGVGWT